jgi:hypothetical protein
MHRFNMGIIGPKTSFSTSGTSGFFSPNVSLVEAGAGSSSSGLGPDITKISYANDYLDVSSEESAPQGVTFKPDGTRAYICGNSSDKVFQYNLSTAWDLSTGSYSTSFNTPTVNPRDLALNNDGTKIYTIDGTQVFQATLSTAYDLSTASDDGSSARNQLPVSGVGLCFASDGSAFYWCDSNARNIYQVNLTTAYDVSTGSSISYTLNYPSNMGYIAGAQCLDINADGTKMLLITNGSTTYSATAYVLEMSTPNDLSTVSLQNGLGYNFLASSPQDSYVTGVYIKPAGDAFYVSSLITDSIVAYNC